MCCFACVDAWRTHLRNFVLLTPPDEGESDKSKESTARVVNEAGRKEVMKVF